jgi:predicted component of type VI protein secretion system
MLLAVCGRGLPETRNQHLFPDEVFAASAGLLSRKVRSASGIRRCIANQFNVPVLVKEFISERIYLPRKIQTRLSSAETGYNALGNTTIVGESLITHRQRFEVRLGPLSRDEFESLCPYVTRESEKRAIRSNLAFRRLVDLIKSILGRPLDFDVRFQVKPDAVSPTQLGSTRLGFDSWVISEPTKQYRDDTVKRFTWDVSS